MSEEDIRSIIKKATAKAEISLPAAKRRAAERMLAFSEESLSLTFAARHRGRLHFVNALGKWYVYTDNRFRDENTLLVYDLAREHLREAAEMAKADKKVTLAMELQTARKVAAVERMSRSDRAIALTVEQLDAHPELINTPAGTLEIKTGKMRENRPEDLLTRCTAVAPGGECPLWERTLERLLPDKETRRFLQLAAGYWLTGFTHEHALFFFDGTGANGKTLVLNTLAGVFGDYATTSPIEAFTETLGDRHPTELARLRGARLVTAVETEEGRRWAESKIKTLTGGDKIAAHFMRQDFFEFQPEFKLVIAGNHKPGLRGVDEGIRRRMNLIPFAVTIPQAERDEHLFDKLKAEWPGILQWVIDGALDWMGEGLAQSAEIRTATEEYLGEEDAIGQWLAECCIVKPGFYSLGADLYRSWKAWATKAGEFVGSQKRFTRSLIDRGFDQHRGTGGSRGFDGISVQATPAWPESDEGGDQ